MPMLIRVFLMSAMLAAAPALAATRVPEPVPATSADLRAAVRAAGARATLVNVWASWCLPCREEFPALLEARKKLGPRGFELLLVTTDFEADLPQAVKFLREQGVTFRTWRKRERDADFIEGLSPDWSGALPCSILYDRDGRILRTWEGPVTYELLKSEMDALDQSEENDTP